MRIAIETLSKTRERRERRIIVGLPAQRATGTHAGTLRPGLDAESIFSNNDRRRFAMHPLEIRFELLKRGFRQRDASRYMGVSDSTVCNVISGKKTSFRVASLIAELIERDIDDVFPGRYTHRLHKAAA